MEAGEELEVLVEFNWNKIGVTKDWSVTVWGEVGEVLVIHNDAILSEHFSFTEKGQMDIDNYKSNLVVQEPQATVVDSEEPEPQADEVESEATEDKVLQSSNENGQQK